MNTIQRIRMIWKCKAEIILDLKKNINLIAFQKEWRNRNPNNGTTAKNIFNADDVKVGEGTYGELRVLGFGNPEEKLSIGSYCSIAGDVTFLLGGIHPMDRITTFPYASHILKRPNIGYTPTKGEIKVQDDVWICHGVLVLSGVTIGKGSVIGARSVVSKDIPPYSVFYDGHVIRKRFEDDIIEFLLTLDLGNIKHLDEDKQEWLFNNAIDKEHIDMVRGWFEDVRSSFCI